VVPYLHDQPPLYKALVK